MKVHHLLQPLNESINLTRFSSDIERAINTGLIATVKDFLSYYNSFVKQRVETDERFKSLEDDKYVWLVDRVGSELEWLIASRNGSFIRALESQLKQIVDTFEIKGNNTVPSVVFKLDMQHSGYATANEITLSLKTFVPPLVDGIKAYIHDNIFDWRNGTYPEDIHAMLKKLSSETDIVDYIYNHVHYRDSHKMIDTVTDLTSIILHELVHVIQQRREQSNGANLSTYRSYVEPSRRKFYDAITNWSEETSRKLHAGSPQEIAAFAQNIAYDIIKQDYGFDKARSVSELNMPPERDIMYRAKVFLDYFDPNHRVEKRVRQRYLKLIYKEIADYLSHKRTELMTKEAQ